jgi:hypothetical protein
MNITVSAGDTAALNGEAKRQGLEDGVALVEQEVVLQVAELNAAEYERWWSSLSQAQKKTIYDANQGG